MSFCKGCGAKIDWFSTPLGKRMPLDEDPHPDGNVRYFSVKNMIAVVEPGSYPVLYRCHFQTCPNAEDFRRAAARRKGRPYP